jgi:hypothetical protein
MGSFNDGSVLGPQNFFDPGPYCEVNKRGLGLAEAFIEYKRGKIAKITSESLEAYLYYEIRLQFRRVREEWEYFGGRNPCPHKDTR